MNQSYLWYVQRDLLAVKVRRTLLLRTCSKKSIVDNELTQNAYSTFDYSAVDIASATWFALKNTMAEGKRNLPAFAIGQPLRGPPGQVPPRPGAFAGGFQSMIDPRAAAGMLSAI